VCVRSLTILVLTLTCSMASAAPHSLTDCANFPKIRERALAAALDRCQRDSKEKCRFAVASEKPDVLNPEIVPESQYQKERNGEIDTRPQEVRHYAFSEADMQWFAQECPVVQLWAAGEVEQRSCRKVVYAFRVRGVGDLHGVIEKLIRMDKAADVAHQLTSTNRFDEPTASWAQRCIQIAHEFYNLMVQVPPSGTP
jgi:hypothetical protein